MRGKSKSTVEIVKACYSYLEVNHPAGVRGCCYKLFVLGSIPDMSKNSTGKISRILTDAREERIVPWSWITDETRKAERTSVWTDKAEFGRCVLRSFRKDFWATQPIHLEVWSEKGTIRGILAPVLEEFAVTFRVMHGFGSATQVNDIAELSAAIEKPSIALYVGDWDPSGLYMSECDLPERIDRYNGSVKIERIALIKSDLAGLPSFPASDKKNDPRYPWFVKNHGTRCWELDAMEPHILRARVREAILSHINEAAWDHASMVEEAERESIKKTWG